ncbi:tRNA (adenosine(37)-N6)-threonylcarbamoyltransferase complex transferase subunit TsaD [Candidatus Dojkabacteria bacterium]|nr:tRNA (adenosine(37)-N6)-threonylcarbamoyltransferase complex transferase subunit TsaD [Candidatus Dojkabacteria bacterium]
MNILAIDTSCDETSVAVLKNDRVISNTISSQIELHKKWGGVVPTIAKRAHQEKIDKVTEEALKKARLDINNIDAIAVTYGPGLAIALEVGIKKAQKLAIDNGISLIPINHMEGHLLSSFAKNSKGNSKNSLNLNEFPIIGILISGGHTELIYSEKIGSYKIIGETLDDAAGEAFDKLAKMLDLGYPGGPVISEFARKGSAQANRFHLPIPMEKSADMNFSFSGLKTACLYKIREIQKQQKSPKTWVYDFCAEFEQSVIKSLEKKLKIAIDTYHPKCILMGGGVISNQKIRKAIKKIAKDAEIKAYHPYSSRLFTDNAAMVGIAAYLNLKQETGIRILENSREIMELDRNPVAQINEKYG